MCWVAVGKPGEQQASNRLASPEREGVERQGLERGLTFEVTLDQRWGAWPAISGITTGRLAVQVALR